MNSSTVFAGLCSPNCERPFCAWSTSCQACQSPSGNWNCCEMCDKLGPFVNGQIDNTCWIIENYCDSQHAFSLYPSGCSRSPILRLLLHLQHRQAQALLFPPRQKWWNPTKYPLGPVSVQPMVFSCHYGVLWPCCLSRLSFVHHNTVFSID